MTAEIRAASGGGTGSDRLSLFPPATSRQERDHAAEGKEGEKEGAV